MDPLSSQTPLGTKVEVAIVWQTWPLADIFSGPDNFEEGLQVLKNLISSSPICGSLNAESILSHQSQLTQKPQETPYQTPYILE